MQLHEILIDSQGYGEGEKTYDLKHLFYILPLSFMALSFGLFVGWFYTLFPIQLLWLPLGILISLFII